MSTQPNLWRNPASPVILTVGEDSLVLKPAAAANLRAAVAASLKRSQRNIEGGQLGPDTAWLEHRRVANLVVLLAFLDGVPAPELQRRSANRSGRGARERQKERYRSRRSSQAQQAVPEAADHLVERNGTPNVTTLDTERA